MKVDLNAVLKDHRNRACTGADGKPATLGDTVELALVGGPWPKDEITSDEKRLRFRIAVKIANAVEVPGPNEGDYVAKELELTATEILTIKKVCDFAYPSPVVVSAIDALLDPADKD